MNAAHSWAVSTNEGACASDPRSTPELSARCSISGRPRPGAAAPGRRIVQKARPEVRIDGDDKAELRDRSPTQRGVEVQQSEIAIETGVNRSARGITRSSTLSRSIRSRRY